MPDWLAALDIAGKVASAAKSVGRLFTRGGAHAIPRKTVVLIPQHRINALYWSTGGIAGKPALQIVGDFHVTNTWTEEVRLAGALLRWGEGRIFRRVEKGSSMVKDRRSPYSGDYPIPSHAMTDLRVAFVFPSPPREEATPLVADVGIIDQFGNVHWAKHLTFKHPNAML